MIAERGGNQSSNRPASGQVLKNEANDELVCAGNTGNVCAMFPGVEELEIGRLKRTHELESVSDIGNSQGSAQMI